MGSVITNYIVYIQYYTIKGLGILLFKANCGYKLKILLMPQQAKKISKIVKERMENLYSYIKTTMN